MVSYSLGEVLFIIFGGLLLSLILTWLPGFVFLGAPVIIAFSTIFMTISTHTLRKKLVFSIRFSVSNMSYNAKVRFAFIAFMFLGVFALSGNSESFEYSSYDFFRVAIISPVFEEILFRGVILGYLFSFTKLRFFSFAIVSFLFSCLHGQDLFIYSFLLSMLLCYTRLVTNSIFPCILLHSCHNALFLVLNGDLTS